MLSQDMEHSQGADNILIIVAIVIIIIIIIIIFMNCVFCLFYNSDFQATELTLARHRPFEL